MVILLLISGKEETNLCKVLYRQLFPFCAWACVADNKLFDANYGFIHFYFQGYNSKKAYIASQGNHRQLDIL